MEWIHTSPGVLDDDTYLHKEPDKKCKEEGVESTSRQGHRQT